MAESEKVAVEVQDKVAPTIKRSIDGIGKSADQSASAVERLQRQTAQLQLRNDRLEISNNKVTASRNALTASTHKQIASEQRIAQQMARTTVEQNKAAQSTMRLAQSRDKAARVGRGGAVGSAGSAFARTLASGGSLASAATSGVASASNDLNPAALAFTALGGAVISAAGTFVTFADRYNGLQNILKNVTGSLQGNGQLLMQLGQIANETANPIDSVVEGFARFDRTLKPLGKTQQESLQFTATLSKMLFVYGKSGGEAASATLQLSQAMGKGKLDGDEFRSVMENLPELGTALAQELGVARGELAKLAPLGKITGDVIFNAMKRAKEQVDALPEPIIRLEAAFTKVSNNMTLWLGSLEEAANGPVAAFARAIANLGDNFGYLAEQQQKQNILAKDWTNTDNVRQYLGVTKEFLERNPQLVKGIDQVAMAFIDLKAPLGRTKEEIAGLQDAGLSALDLLKGNAQELLALETKRTAEGEAMNKKNREDLSQRKQLTIELEKQRKLAGDEREQFIDAGLEKFKAAGMLNEQLVNERKILGEMYDLDHKREVKITDYIAHMQTLLRLGKEVSTSDFMKAIDQSEKERVDVNFTDMSKAEDRELNKMLGIDDSSWYGKTKKAKEKRGDVTPADERKQLDKGIEGIDQYAAFTQERIQSVDYMYGEIEKLNQRSILNEQQTANAKKKIWEQEQTSKLGLATTFFDSFVGLSKSKNQEVAAIGKAAAIANATITTYQAANAAMASLAGIPFVGPGLAAAAVTGIIATGMLNVAEIASAPTGFKSGGYTGNMPANDVAGVVHGQEYVMPAAATKRIGRDNLDAMRSGEAPAQGSVGTPLAITLILVDSKEEAEQAAASAEGDKVFLEKASRNGQQLNVILRSAS